MAQAHRRAPHGLQPYNHSASIVPTIIAGPIGTVTKVRGPARPAIATTNAVSPAHNRVSTCPWTTSAQLDQPSTDPVSAASRTSPRPVDRGDTRHHTSQT